jgi:hypothetical protein
MTNNKQQTAVKLYTEEHLKLFYQLGKFDGIARRETDVEEEIKNHLPIELPSDEEIEQSSLKWFMTANKHEIIFDLGWMKIFEAGAKYAINKIQGGEQ